MKTRTDGLRSRLARLEKLAGRDACPICRLQLRHTWHGGAKPRPKDPEDPALIVAALCHACGATTGFDLSGYPEDLREVMRLYWTSKLEDTFTDPRAWSALSWVIYRDEAQAHRREALREMRKLSAPEMGYHQQQQLYHARQRRRRERERAREKDPDFKLFNGLLAEAQALNRQLRKRLERRHGRNPFPELEVRIEAVKRLDYEYLYKGEAYGQEVRFRPMYDIEQAAESWLRCAEMEKVILGSVSATTTGRVADCERLALEVLAIARAKYEAREEERRREEAERERLRLERLAASAPLKPAPPATPPALPLAAPVFPPPTLAAPRPPSTPPEAEAPVDRESPAPGKGLRPTPMGWRWRRN